MKTLGERIRERREELDLSLREFAKQLACSPPFISDIEHGKRFPSEQNLEAIARALKLSLNELKALDPRAPFDEMKKMTERDPTYAFAFRSIADSKVSAKEIIEFVEAISKDRKK